MFAIYPSSNLELYKTKSQECAAAAQHHCDNYPQYSNLFKKFVKQPEVNKFIFHNNLLLIIGEII